MAYTGDEGAAAAGGAAAAAVNHYVQFVKMLVVCNWILIESLV